MEVLSTDIFETYGNKQDMLCLCVLFFFFITVHCIGNFFKNTLLCLSFVPLCIQAPVKDVEEQISHRKYNSGVRVNHVAVAHNEVEVVFYCFPAAKPGPF